MLRRAGYILVTLALLLGGALPMVWAARLQSGKTLKIKACVGLIPTPGGDIVPPFVGGSPDPEATSRASSPNPNPYIFWVLDQRKDIKPDGWEFYNPAAPPFVGVQEAARWSIAFGAVPPLTVGQRLTPDMGAYWEEEISEANFGRLREMDVIYLPIGRDDLPQEANHLLPGTVGTPIPTMFTEEQRRVLTKLADAGVTIWLDWALPTRTVSDALGGPNGGTPDTRRKNPFFTNLDFLTTNGPALPPLQGHPLTAGAFVLGSAQALQVGRAIGANPPSEQRGLEIRALDMQPNINFARVVPRAGANEAYIAAGRLGAGFVVATAGNVGAAITPMGFPTRSIFGSQDILIAEEEDLKFAYNVVAWAQETSGPAKNSRHTGQTTIALNGLIENTTYPYLLPTGAAGTPWVPYGTGLAPGSLPVNPASPLVVDDTVIAAVRYIDPALGVTMRIGAWERNPAGDYDFDAANNPDDRATPSPALLDLSIGQNYDLLTQTPAITGATNFCTGMALGEVPDASQQSVRTFVFAACAGSVGIFSLPAPRPGPALPDWSTGAASPGTNVEFTGAPAFGVLPDDPLSGPSVPQLYAGGLYTSPAFGSGNGKVIAYNVAPGTGALAPRWYYPPDQEANRMGAVSGPITVAMVQDQGTGGIDQMVFGTTVSAANPTAGQAQQGAGDTTGKVEGFITATWGDVLTFPRTAGAANANNPQAGRRFVAARWLDIPPGVGQVPQPRELTWDPARYYEVRIMDRQRNYVLARFRRGDPGFTPLLQGTAGQIELPPPTGPLAPFADPQNPASYDLNRFVLLADYSVLPQQVDNNQGLSIRPRFQPPTPYVRNQNQQVQPTGIAGGVAVGKDNLIYYGTGQGYMVAAEWRRGRPQFRWKMRGCEYQDQSGLSQNVDPTNPNFLFDYGFVAAPAAGDRIVFASRGRGSGGTVYILEPDAVIRFRLGPDPPPGTGPQLNAQTAQEVQLQADHGIGFLQSNPFLGATQQPWGRLPNQFSVDPDTRTVTFHNMENFSLYLGNALSPSQLAALGVDTGGRPAVPIQWKYRSEVGAAARIAYIPLPLVAIYTPQPGDRFLSSPVIAGDRVFVMGALGNLHQLPLDPKTVNPRFPVNASGVTGLQGFDMGNTTLYGVQGLRRLKNVAVGSGTDCLSAPAIGPGILAVTSPRGLTTYTNPNIVVADSSRILEATGDSFAQASTDVTVKHRTDQNPFPIPTDPGQASVNAPLVTEKKLLNRPAKVVKLDRRNSLTSLFLSEGKVEAPIDQPTGTKETPDYAESSFLAADTGNNRCVEFNDAGKVVWELTDFQDPLGILPAGEPLKLAGPRDVQRWVSREPDPANPAGTPLYVIHTLIADTENHRVLEVVDKVRYQQGGFNFGSYIQHPGQPGQDGRAIVWYHVLVWASQTNAQGLRLKYSTAQRIQWWNPQTDAPIPNQNGGIGNPFAVPPYIAQENSLSYTMCTVSGQEVTYPGAFAVTGYNRFFGAPGPEVAARKPVVRPGGDSIVFLRGRYKIDETTGGNSVPVGVPGNPFLYRETDPNAAGDRFRFTQGVIDPNVPILTVIHDEIGSANPLNPVRRLNGVSSVQRTIRADVRFAPETFTGSGAPRLMYFLVADTAGVFEARMAPNTGTVHLSFAYTQSDYTYATGGGNGDPALLFSPSPANHQPGGRRFSPSSARRLPNGLVLITSKTAPNEQASASMGPGFQHRNMGGDVFLLRAVDYLRAAERPAGFQFYNPADVVSHGWRPDLWVQTVFAGAVPPVLRGAPSIRWRAGEPPNPVAPPSLGTQLEAGANQYELTGGYLPNQPVFADLSP